MTAATRLKTTLEAIRDAPLTAGQVLGIATGIANQFKDQLAPGQDPATMTNEELAQFSLDQLKRVIRRLVIAHKRKVEEASQVVARKALDDALAAVDSDL